MEHADSNGLLITFSKKIGIVTAALLTVVTLSNTLGGCILQQAMIPITAEINRQSAIEINARLEADRKLSEALEFTITRFSADRITLLHILEHPAGPTRTKLLQEARISLLQDVAKYRRINQ